MIYQFPPAADIIGTSATTSTTGIISVPGGRWFTANIQLNASVAVAGSNTLTVTYHVPGGTAGAAPANGTVLSRITVAGLLAAAAATSSVQEILVYGGDNGCTLDFSAGATGTASCVINGFLI